MLLRANWKWKDWSFVGGHVEPGEEDDWHMTAVRETQEEMPPLRESEDFVVEDTRAVLSWTAPSKSAAGELTQYHVRCFVLQFKRDPRELLPRLRSEEFIVASESWLKAGPRNVGETVVRVLHEVEDRLGPLDLSWPDPIRSEDLPFSVCGRFAQSEGSELTTPSSTRPIERADRLLASN
jgi:hypothetical protein